MSKTYQNLIDGQIFFGGASDVEAMVKNEQVEVIVDLRGEATGCEYPSADVQWIQVPFGDHAEAAQHELVQEAVNHIISAYKEGRKVGFHCAGGNGRTGAIAVAALIELKKCETLEEAEQLAKRLRPTINIKEKQREALKTWFNK